MTRGNLATKLAAAAAAVILGGTAAQAGLLPVSVTVMPEAGNYRWTYAVVLPTDMKLQSGNFFTIYDFGGLIPDSVVAPENWTVQVGMTGPTPDRVNPNDNAAVENLTFQYTGETIASGQIGLGNFMANSMFEGQANSFLTARTLRSSDGLTDSNITELLVPVGPNGEPEEPPVDEPPVEEPPVEEPPVEEPPVETPPPAPGVPEPATLALAGLGLPVVGLTRWIRRRRGN